MGTSLFFSQLNNALQNLLRETIAMKSLYSDKTQCKQSQAAIFLSRVPLEQYYNEEEKFTRQLTIYTKKRFDRVSINFEWIFLSNPKVIIVN